MRRTYRKGRRVRGYHQRQQQQEQQGWNRVVDGRWRYIQRRRVTARSTVEGTGWSICRRNGCDCRRAGSMYQWWLSRRRSSRRMVMMVHMRVLCGEVAVQGNRQPDLAMD